MIVSIMQPTYFPWLGYFDLIARADIFVFLDDVQFSYRSWQQRNRILNLGKEKMLTVPVINKGEGKRVEDILIDESENWREKHINGIKEAYRTSKYYKIYIEFFEKLIQQRTSNLNQLNQSIIKSLSTQLDLNTKFLSSKNIKGLGTKSEKLYNICEALGATQYLSPAGSRSYIEDEGVFSRNKLQVVFQDYCVQTYKQSGSASFVSHLSVIDLIFNCGVANVSKHFQKNFIKSNSTNVENF